MHFEKLLPYLHLMWNGLATTLEITMVSFVIGLFVSILLVALKFSRIKALNLIQDAYVLIFRSVPLLLQLFLVYYAMPQMTGNAIRLSASLAAEITFGLNAAAYIAEVFRGGILGIDPGQREAAKALGVASLITAVYIIFPQMIKKVLPALLNEIITLLKGSALMSQIGVMDLFMSGMTIVKSTYSNFEPYILVAIIYYVLVLMLSGVSYLVERRLKASD